MEIDKTNANGKSNKGCSNIFQIIVGIATIVGCIAAVCVVPQIQGVFARWIFGQTLTPTHPAALPTPTDYTFDGSFLNTQPGIILEPEQVWYFDSFQIRLRKPTFNPCTYVLLAFELSFQNTSTDAQDANFRGVDIVVTDPNGRYLTKIFFYDGGIKSDCYGSYSLDRLDLKSFLGNSRLDYVFYSYDEAVLNTGDYFLVTILKFGNGENAVWKIPVK